MTFSSFSEMNKEVSQRNIGDMLKAIKFGFCPNCGRVQCITDLNDKCDCTPDTPYTLIPIDRNRYNGNNKNEFKLVANLLKLGVIVPHYFLDASKTILEKYNGFQLVFSKDAEYEFVAVDEDAYGLLCDTFSTFNYDYQKVYFEMDDEHNRIVAINRCSTHNEFERYMEENIIRIMANIYVGMSDMAEVAVVYEYDRLYFCTSCGNFEYIERDDIIDTYHAKCKYCKKPTLIALDEFSSSNPKVVELLKEYFNLGYIPMSFFEIGVPLSVVNGKFTLITTQDILKQVICKDYDHMSRCFYNAVDELKFDEFKIRTQFSSGLRSVEVTPIPYNNPMPQSLDEAQTIMYYNTAIKYLVEFYEALLPVLKKHLGLKSDAK